VQQLHFGALQAYWSALPMAVWTTVSLSTVAVLLGLPVGLGGAVARRYGAGGIRWAFAAYVEFMRNTPLIVLLFLVYFGLPQTGLRLGGYASALIALTLNCSAYMIEVFRGGLEAIPRGQYEAATALGLTALQRFRLAIFPQLLRVTYPSLGNIFIQVLLGSSLASVVAVSEIADWMQNAGSQTFRFFETFAVAGGVYILLCQGINIARIVIGKYLFKSSASVGATP
jgi:His/Glu/Gln/Arg/opine family amino acid ABC transporter permease subunit